MRRISASSACLLACLLAQPVVSRLPDLPDISRARGGAVAWTSGSPPGSRRGSSSAHTALADLSRNLRGGATATADEDHELVADEEDDDTVPDLDDARKTVTVVTSASLPWMTGTAVNPLLRAAHLTKDREAGAVTLLVPWIDVEDQRKLFPNNVTFATQADQRAYVLQWVAEAAAMPAAARKLTVSFYPGRYLSSYGSIFSIGPYLESVPSTDFCILEEPEHLAWFRYPEVGWADKFSWVVGVMHTNYLAYAREEAGPAAVPPVWALNQLCGRAYCHRLVKLSATLQSYAPHKECVSNVHGVRQAFLDAGRRADLVGFPGDVTTVAPDAGGARPVVRTAQCYFVSKQLWAKGYRLLFQLLAHYRRVKGEGLGGGGLAVDLYGSGPDSAAIGKKALQTKLDVQMKGYADHAKLGQYKVFINPSVTEVLCTTVAEALAMNKWVVCPVHPSNDFFASFPNCLQYNNPSEFAACVEWALATDPPPLLPEVRFALTWTAAMQRLRAASNANPTPGRQGGRSVGDRACAAFYKWLGAGRKGDWIRALSGGGKCAWQVAYAQEQAAATATDTSR